MNAMGWFRFRLWVGDQLFALAGWVMPEHRYNHRENEDGSITIWREPS